MKCVRATQLFVDLIAMWESGGKGGKGGKGGVPYLASTGMQLCTFTDHC